jgi:hypothetical protein
VAVEAASTETSSRNGFKALDLLNPFDLLETAAGGPGGDAYESGGAHRGSKLEPLFWTADTAAAGGSGGGALEVTEATCSSATATRRAWRRPSVASTRSSVAATRRSASSRRSTQTGSVL